MPMNSLSSLLTGFRSASHLARISRIDVHDVGALRTADAIFATEYRPFLPNDF